MIQVLQLWCDLYLISVIHGQEAGDRDYELQTTYLNINADINQYHQ